MSDPVEEHVREAASKVAADLTANLADVLPAGSRFEFNTSPINPIMPDMMQATINAAMRQLDAKIGAFVDDYRYRHKLPSDAKLMVEFVDMQLDATATDRDDGTWRINTTIRVKRADR
jgi:hypothetical protein